MSWHTIGASFDLSTYLQGLEEESSRICSLDTESSEHAKSKAIAERSCCNASAMASCQASQSGTTCEPSTGIHGVDTSISSRPDSPAKISAPPETEQELKDIKAPCGLRYQELYVRYDRVSSSWKTHQCLWEEDLPWSSVTLPKWGMMLDGVLLEPTSLPRIYVKESGFWPTPVKSDAFAALSPLSLIRKEMGLRRPSGAEIGGSLKWFRKSVENWSLDGVLFPTLHELLMIWPIGWTDCRPLAMDRFQSWLLLHGGF